MSTEPNRSHILETFTPRRLHVLLNPVSGKGKARQVFQEVRPLLEGRHLQLTVTESTAKGHGVEICRNLAIEEVDGLVVVGGDGTIHEAINGLMGRSDWQRAMEIPIGAIPAGTGNGLCKTLLEMSGKPYDPLSAAFLIAQGQVRSLDLVRVVQPPRQYYSFLSLSWGLVSDVDIESERLRFFGSLRSDLYALLRILNLRTYKGRFSFLPAMTDEDSPSGATKRDSQAGNWQTMEDEFVLLWAMNFAWAAHDMKTAPRANLCDGAMDVLVVRRGISKWQLLAALLKIADGSHITLPGIDDYKVRCLSLEPLTSKGILAVDGEQVDYSPVQMEVLPGLARVFCS